MALGTLTIMTIISAILIISVITLAFLKKNDIFDKTWFIVYILILIGVLTVLTFTALPSNYVIYKVISASLGLVGALGVYLGKAKKFNLSIALIAISLLGNFYIVFLM